MLISERFCAGFALAATIARDRDAELASSGLHPSIAEPLRGTVRALGALSKKERRDRVRAYLQAQPLIWPSAPAEPRRAYMLLAQGDSAEALPEWLRASNKTRPHARPGYKPAPELLALLRRSATR